jgi:hypothetical protein
MTARFRVISVIVPVVCAAGIITGAHRIVDGKTDNFITLKPDKKISFDFPAEYKKEHRKECCGDVSTYTALYGGINVKFTAASSFDASPLTGKKDFQDYVRKFILDDLRREETAAHVESCGLVTVNGIIMGHSVLNEPKMCYAHHYKFEIRYDLSDEAVGSFYDFEVSSMNGAVDRERVDRLAERIINSVLSSSPQWKGE